MKRTLLPIGILALAACASDAEERVYYAMPDAEMRAAFTHDGVYKHPPMFPSSCEFEIAEGESVELVVGFDVDADGRTQNVTIVSSQNDCFNDAAVSAVEKWEYDPDVRDLPLKDQTGKIKYQRA